MYTTLTLWVIRSLNNTLLSLAPSPSVYISIHTHTQCFLRLPYISVSPPASLFLCYDHHGDFGAVGPCSQSLHYSAFSSRSACPSLCVSTACLNYSHRSHYWVHLFPPAPFLQSIAPPPSLKNHQGETGGLQGLGGGGHISCILSTVKWECLSSFTRRDESLPATFLGWIIQSLPAGTESNVNLYDFQAFMPMHGWPGVNTLV